MLQHERGTALGAVALKPDPPVRKDGLCAQCKGPRNPERSRLYGKHHAEFDPFCSNLCARAFHGNPLPQQSFGPTPLTPSER